MASKDQSELTADGRENIRASSKSETMSSGGGKPPDSVSTPLSKETTGVGEGDNPFDIELTEYVEDKSLVNVHQFYPTLEHTFTKSSTVFAEEQDRRVEEAMKEIVQEDSFTSREETQRTIQFDAEDSMRIVSRLGDTDRERKSDDNNSADVQPGGVFSTAVDEQTIAEAKARAEKKSIFHTEEWTPQRYYTETLQEIVEKSSDDHFARAMKLKEKGDFESAIININKALTLRTEEAVYYVERAEAFIQLCDFQSAILNYKKACLLEPDNDEHYSRLAFLYYFQGQMLFDQHLYPEALEAFSRAAEMKPDNVGYHIRSITCLAALQRHGECLALVNKRLENENDNPDLYVMRARLHEMFRNTTLSYYDVKDALALDPDHREAKVMMGRLEKRAQNNKLQAMQMNLTGKYREALQKISIAIETNPSVADFHVLRGALQRRLGDFNAAIDDFLLALDKCDHNEESPVYTDSQRQLLLTYNDFAVECFTKGFYDEAIILLNKAIKGEKREKGLYVNRGDCFFKQGELNFALQDYHQALELDSVDQNVKSRISIIHNEFGVNAYQDKSYSEAETKFTFAITFNTKVGQYYISRSRARYMLENMTGARQDLIMGLLLDPTNEDVISILSRLFPGKSVADIINSRAADAAKLALQESVAPRTASIRTRPIGDEGDTETRTSPRSPGAETEETSGVDERLWKPGGCFPDLKACMQERDFNMRQAHNKKRINNKVKGALNDRKSLKYLGSRMQPLPPSRPKPVYGGNILGRENLFPRPESEKPISGWKALKFSSGIGLADAN